MCHTATSSIAEAQFCFKKEYNYLQTVILKMSYCLAWPYVVQFTFCIGLFCCCRLVNSLNLHHFQIISQGSQIFIHVLSATNFMLISLGSDFVFLWCQLEHESSHGMSKDILMPELYKSQTLHDHSLFRMRN